LLNAFVEDWRATILSACLPLQVYCKPDDYKKKVTTEIMFITNDFNQALKID
jgi:hypothetical protein